MPLSNPGLWARMQAYDFPLPHMKEFAGLLPSRLYQALCKESALDASKCALVLEEYRRFIYLVAVGNEVLAPSPSVDFVWHIHLGFKAAYADDFCAGIMGKNIRHIEGRPKAHEDPAYQRTLVAYIREFGTDPDPRIWPSAEVLKRRARSPFLVAVGVAAIGVAAFLLPPVVTTIAFFGLVLLVVVEEPRMPWSHRISSSGGGGCGGDGDGGCGGGD